MPRLSSFEKAIEEAVRRAYISGKSGESLTRRINAAVKGVIKKYGATATMRKGKDYAKEVVAELDSESFKIFSANRKVARAATENASELVLGLKGRLDHLDEKAAKSIIGAMQDLEPGETNWRPAARAALQKAGIAERHAKTEVETFVGAMDRASVIDTAIKGGVKKFKYVGPSDTQRPFCIDKVGRIFTIEELEGMNNGQGLPGMYYCGGYGCRHRLVPVVE